MQPGCNGADSALVFAVSEIRRPTHTLLRLMNSMNDAVSVHIGFASYGALGLLPPPPDFQLL